MKQKKAAILVENIYQDLEVWYPALRLKEEGYGVKFVGPIQGQEYKGKYGYPVISDIGIGQCGVKDFDVVVIPGGFAPDFLRRSPAIIKFVKDMYAANKIIASICHGGWILASAGIIKGKTVTSFSAIKDDLVNAGAKFVDKEVVVSGNIITSRKPEDLPAFVRAIIDSL